MKKKIIGTSIVLFCVILVSNFIPSIQVGETFYFQTKNKEFTYRAVPSKGRTEADMEEKFAAFRNADPKNEDLILYRTFEKYFWKFWMWRKYLTHPRWQYQHISQA